MKPKAELHLSCCDCPHVNIVIVDNETGEHGHFACGADEAEAIAEQIRKLAAEARVKSAVRLNFRPVGHA